ncbi:hypothetical protein ACFX16_026592 [Malus domestica]
MDCRERKRGMSQNLEQGHVRPIRARFHHPFFSSSLLSRLSLLTTHFVSPDSLFATRNGLSNEYPIKSGETRGDVAPNHHQSKDVASKSPPIEGQLRIVNPTPQQVCSLIVYPTLNGICDHFYSVTIMEAEARAEFVCQVQSPAKASSRLNLSSLRARFTRKLSSSSSLFFQWKSWTIHGAHVVEPFATAGLVQFEGVGGGPLEELKNQSPAP